MNEELKKIRGAADSPQAPATVILVHGLWTPAAVFLPHDHWLQRHGYRAPRFGYVR